MQALPGPQVNVTAPVPAVRTYGRTVPPKHSIHPIPQDAPGAAPLPREWRVGTNSQSRIGIKGGKFQGTLSTEYNKDFLSGERFLGD